MIRSGAAFRGCGGRGAGRHEVTADALQLITCEKNDQSLSHFLALVIHQCVNIVPAILVEGIGNQWRAHNETNLSTSHAGAKFVNHVLCDDVALLYHYFVGARKFEITTGTDHRGECQANNNAYGKEHDRVPDDCANRDNTESTYD